MVFNIFMKGKVDSLSVIAGIVMVVLGIGLMILGLFFPFVLFYAVPVLIIGIVILFTLKQQEEVEQIKEHRKK